MIAAVLDLHKSAGASFKAVEQMRRRLSDFHDIGDLNTLWLMMRISQFDPCLRFAFFVIADDLFDLGHIAKHGGVNLRGTSCHQNIGIGAFAL